MAYAHGIEFERRASRVTSKATLLKVAKAFGMFWWFFGALSVWATYYTLNVALKDFFTVDQIIMMGLTFGLAVIWDIFKYFSLEWVFADQELSTKISAVVVFVGLVGGSMWFHWFGSELRNSNSATNQVASEVTYRREINAQKLELQKLLIKQNSELTPVLNNGTSVDDKKAVKVISDSLSIVENLEKQKTEVVGAKELLDVYKENASVKADGVMFSQIIAETFLLFSLLSKFILVANRDESMKEYFEAKEALLELLAVTKHDKTAEFIQTALDELNGYAIAKNRTGLGFVNEKIDRARAFLRPNKELPQSEREPTTGKTKLLGMGMKEEHKPYIPYTDCEAEIKEVETETQIENEKVKALDLKMWDDEEKIMLRVLWDNGNKHKGDKLVKREIAVIEIAEKGVERASVSLTALYGNLLRAKMIRLPGVGQRYIAEVSLSKELWVEKE